MNIYPHVLVWALADLGLSLLALLLAAVFSGAAMAVRGAGVPGRLAALAIWMLALAALGAALLLFALALGTVWRGGWIG